VSELEKYDALVLGSGTGVKLIARTMASEGNRTASIERKSWRIIFSICFALETRIRDRRDSCHGEIG
jgi:choline dehydrogenase-like flavoprotein